MSYDIQGVVIGDESRRTKGIDCLNIYYIRLCTYHVLQFVSDNF